MLCGEGAELNAGDVIQVNRQMKDKKTGKPYVWRFFAVVCTPPDDWGDLECIPFGAVSEQRKDRVMRLELDDNDFKSGLQEIYLLTPEEWPDGVHANRMRMILTGLVKII